MNVPTAIINKIHYQEGETKMNNNESNYYKFEMQKLKKREKALRVWGKKKAEHWPCGKIRLKELAK